MVAELQQQFEQAVAESKQLSEKPSNETLLKLYALYKQSTEGDVHTDPPANPFDFVAKAKYEAWTEQKGKAKETAMKEYTELVDYLKSN
jgi:diazepam-binding inhibitor (GABA receptor modulator, acyl-CoA-binding protein)